MAGKRRRRTSTPDPPASTRRRHPRIPDRHEPVKRSLERDGAPCVYRWVQPGLHRHGSGEARVRTGSTDPRQRFTPPTPAQQTTHARPTRHVMDDPSDWELRKGSTPTLPPPHQTWAPNHHKHRRGNMGSEKWGGVVPIGEEDKESHHEGKECHRL